MKTAVVVAQTFLSVLKKCVCVVFLISNSAGAQEYFHLLHADSWVGIEGFNRYNVIGSVHYYIETRNIHIYCDTTEVFDKEGIYVLRSNVRILDPDKRLYSNYIRYNIATEEAYSPDELIFEEPSTSRRFRADRGTYNYKTNVLITAGNGIYADSSYTLFGDQFTYIRNEKDISVFGNIRFYDVKNNAVGYANTADYQQNKKYGILKGNPRLAVTDSVRGDSLIITGLTMEFFGDSIYRYIVTDSVAIQKGEITAYCQKGVYDTSVSKIYLRGNPRISEETFIVLGREIDLHIRNRALSEMVVRDSAVVLSDADTSGTYDIQNELRGKTITVYFNDDKIQKIAASINAEVTYYGFENNELQWRQTGTYSQIIITLTDGRIDNVNGSKGSGIVTPKSKLQDIKKKKGMYEY